MVPKVFHPLPDYTHLGYNFGDETSKNKLLYGTRPHSGIDYNWGVNAASDLGKPFFNLADGIVVYVAHNLADWGTLAVVYHPDLGVWSRYGHWKTFLYKEGDAVKGGEQLGGIGDGNRKFSPHLHYDIIKIKLDIWSSYTKGMTKEMLNATYAHPEAYIKQKQAEYQKSLAKLNVDPDWFIKEDVRAWAANYLEDVDAFLANPDPRKILAVMKRVEENFEARLSVVEKALKKIK